MSGALIQKEKQQMEFGETAISGICIDPTSRDDIPTVLKGLQLIYTTLEHRERVFELLIGQVLAGVDLKVGYPEIDLWRLQEPYCYGNLKRQSIDFNNNS